MSDSSRRDATSSHVDSTLRDPTQPFDPYFNPRIESNKSELPPGFEGNDFSPAAGDGSSGWR